MLHRPDTRNLNIPSHVEMFPFFYMDSSVFNRAREESVVVTKPGARVRIPIYVVQCFRFAGETVIFCVSLHKRI